MRQAGQTTKQPRFENATLYSTLQPCGMCSMACIWAGISRIVYGAQEHQVHSMYFEGRHLRTMDFVRDAFKDDLTVVGGVLGDECAQLYYGPEDNPPPAERTNT
jgi:tRNA(adenine34) deaminase